MNYNFEEFTERNTRRENRITITRSYSIGLPQFFFEKNKIHNFKYAVLFFDKKNEAIAIHFTNEEKENAFKIMKSKKGYGGHIVARSFFTYYDINPKIYYGRYEWEKYNLEGVGEVFVIKLKKRNKDKK